MTTENIHARLAATTSASNVSNITSQTAALKGAALAFGKPPVKPKPNVDTYRGANGALAAAKKANSATSRGIDERIRPQASGSSSSSEGGGSGLGSPRAVFGQFLMDASGHLKTPGEPLGRTTSPSFIAATLAASRSVPISPSHTGAQPASSSPRQSKHSSGARSPSSMRSGSRPRSIHRDALDTSSISSTKSSSGMFEKTGVKSLIETPTSATTVARARPPDIEAPKPIRARIVSITQEAIVSPPSKLEPVSPHRRGGAPLKLAKKAYPRLNVKNADEDVSSDDSFVSASDTRPIIIPAELQKPRPPNITSTQTPMTVDGLANAIVASSLASRNASPTKLLLTGPPPPPPRRTNHLFHHHDTRTPSPAKGFRTTMRKPREDEEEDKTMLRMGKKNLMKKHPNKHHEGDRKRWRDAITERERKRYEAVWASNRGLFIGISSVKTSFSPPPRAAASSLVQNADMESVSDAVSNIVVRDIWSRSRLGDAVLEEVWNLVDRSGSGKLSREEFVTGLWLIDQRLKGRKLPMRVSESVWTSSGAQIGVMVRGDRRKVQR